MGVSTIWGSQQPFSCVLGQFGMVEPNRTKEQLCDPRARLLLTSEKKTQSKFKM